MTVNDSSGPDLEKAIQPCDNTSSEAGPIQRNSSSLHSRDSHEFSSSEPDHEEEKKIDKVANDEEAAPATSPGPALDGGVLGEPIRVVDEAQSRRAPSRASSARSKPLVVVPPSKRRGLFGRFTIVPEVEQPYDYPTATKWWITVVISIATAGAPMGSSIFYPALASLSKDLHTTQTIGNLSVSFYMLAMSLFPLWWSAFSEEYGRRSIYLVSFALFVIFSILCGFSENITMLIVFRLCGGGASASVQAVGAGTLADIWESHERGRAMGFYYLGPLLGPLLAPIIGGALAERFGWRSTMWFLAVLGFVTWILIFFFLPETLARRSKDERPDKSDELRRMTTAESAKVRSKKFAANLKKFLVDPLAVILFLRFPPVLITVLVAAFAFAALFITNISIQQGFAEPPYNYQELIVGLLYIPPGLGYFSATVLGGRWIDQIMAREAKKANRYDENGKLIFLPEDRMRENMWLAHIVYPLALLGYGWTLRYGIQFMAPSVFLFLFGFSSMLVFTTATTMLTEFVRKRSSGGVAVNNFVRNILSCVGTVVAAPWFNAMGFGWVFTIICIFCMVTGFAGIWVLRRYGPRWRKSMDQKLNGA